MYLALRNSSLLCFIISPVLIQFSYEHQLRTLPNGHDRHIYLREEFVRSLPGFEEMREKGQVCDEESRVSLAEFKILLDWLERNFEGGRDEE